MNKQTAHWTKEETSIVKPTWMLFMDNKQTLYDTSFIHEAGDIVGLWVF